MKQRLYHYCKAASFKVASTCGLQDLDASVILRATHARPFLGEPGLHGNGLELSRGRLRTFNELPR